MDTNFDLEIAQAGFTGGAGKCMALGPKKFNIFMVLEFRYVNYLYSYE